ncbi:MAG: NUDIX hydrolase [Oscillospiraceae bacterium]|nr:NUDIX hydrolase [Oscillospiraceae bacterium]
MYIEKEVSRETVFEGRIINVRADVAEIHGGTRVPREVVEHPGGVCVVPVDADGSFWCVRQFRYPIMKELLEFPAGKLERGEDPLKCAVRELKEETGLVAGRVIYLDPIYTSPGFSNEVLHLYLALDLQKGKSNPDEGEFLTVERIARNHMLAMALQNELPDAKTMVGLFKAMQYLQQEGGFPWKRQS